MLVDAVLSDWQTAPIDEPRRVTLGFLAKMTLTPNELAPADAEPLNAAGLSLAAIEDAVHVCALFNIYSRVADALGFDVPSPEGFARLSDVLLSRGYR